MTPREEAIAAVARAFAGTYDEGSIVDDVFAAVGLDLEGNQTLVEYPWHLDCVPGMVAEWALPGQPTATWTRVRWRHLWFAIIADYDEGDDNGVGPRWQRSDNEIPDDAVLRWDPRWIIGQERPDA